MYILTCHIKSGKRILFCLGNNNAVPFRWTWLLAVFGKLSCDGTADHLNGSFSRKLYTEQEKDVVLTQP